MITNNNIIKIKINKDHIKTTLETAEKETLNKSMRGRQANLIGTLGEIITHEYLNNINIKTEFDLQYNHDLMLDDILTADVKTKERTVPPQLHYDCTIPEYNHHVQRPDIFIFVSLQSNKKIKEIKRFHTAYLLGYTTMRYLENNAKHWTPEMIDTSNNWTPTIPCFNIIVEQLSPIQKF